MYYIIPGASAPESTGNKKTAAQTVKKKDPMERYKCTHFIFQGGSFPQEQWQKLRRKIDYKKMNSIQMVDSLTQRNNED